MNNLFLITLHCIGLILKCYMVPQGRLELPHISALEPKSSASTNSATRAISNSNSSITDNQLKVNYRVLYLRTISKISGPNLVDTKYLNFPCRVTGLCGTEILMMAGVLAGILSISTAVVSSYSIAAERWSLGSV